jgi:sulfite reductase (ferredoxin)
VPEDELLPLSQAVCRIFARHGEKANRARARLKFLVKKLGLEEFRRVVLEERDRIPTDARWTAFKSDLEAHDQPLKPASSIVRKAGSPAFEAWRKSNVSPQRQPGWSIVSVTLPLGDFTPDQARGLADIMREFVGDSCRLTVEQNLMLRWVTDSDLPALYERLAAVGLGAPGANTIVDVTACPGTDTCKLGISASRGLAGELRTRLAARSAVQDEAVGALRIKVSGCFNSCGQHHVSDLGFLGVQRNISGRRVPHFQVVLGGEWTNNAGSFGLGLGAVPSKRIPEVVDRVTERFVRERASGEGFQAFIKRIGKSKIREMLVDLMDVPTFEAEPDLFYDWSDPRGYTTGDIGVGECAGEIVSVAKFGLSDGERVAFEASDKLEKGDAIGAAEGALAAMLLAAKALVRAQTFDIGDDKQEIVKQFRARYYDTQLFHDKYAGGKFAQYLFRLADRDLATVSLDDAHHYVEEAQLFIEAAYACEARLGEQAVPLPG